MKTLRKTLSLTLVFALVFSLMSFAFAADTTTTTKAPTLSDFTDANKLTYTEAADYLIAAGIVKGETATTLNPKGDFTRAQAAKLVAYAALGQTAADNLKVSVSPFKDVDASNWAAGYIAYCQKQGFVNGYGDGNFGPNDKVTGYQMAKMLLCSIGYGVNGEFTGSGWELAVAPTALSYGIFTSNAAGASAVAATREEAFLYTFNTLSALCNVSYNKTLGVYYVPGRTALTTNPQSSTIGATPDTRMDTVGAIKFGITRQATTDDFDNAAHEWILNKVAVTDTYANDSIKILGTITDGTTITAATTNTNAKYIAGKASTGVTYFYNGAEVSAFAAGTYAVGDLVTSGNLLYKITWAGSITTLSTAPGTAGAALNNAAEYSVKGATVKLMAGTGTYATKVAKVSVIEKTVGIVTATPVKTTSGSVTTIKIPGVVNTATNVNKVEYPSDLAKDDVVLFYTAGGVTYVEKATALTGNMTGYVLDSSANIARVTVGTTNAFVSGLVDTAKKNVLANGLNTTFLNQSGYTYYTDDNGYLCYFVQADDAKTLTNVMYVKAIAAPGLDGNTEFAYVTSDGTVGTAKASTTGATITKGTDESKFFTASKLADGTYKLTAIANQAQFASDAIASGKNAYSITGKQIKFLNKYTAASESKWSDVPSTSRVAAQITIGTAKDITANSSTIFMYYNGTAKTYTVKTGISSALDYDVSNTTNVDVYTDANGVALLVVASGSTSSISSSTNTIFPVSGTQVGYEASTGLTTYTCYAYVNGATTATPVVSYAQISIGNLYYVTSYAANGYPQTVDEAVNLTEYAKTPGSVVGRAATDSKLNIAIGASTITTTWSKGILNIANAKVAENKAFTGAPGSYVVPSTATVYVVDARDTSNISYTTGNPSSIAALDYTGAANVGVISVETSDTDATISAIYLLIK